MICGPASVSEACLVRTLLVKQSGTQCVKHGNGSGRSILLCLSWASTCRANTRRFQLGRLERGARA
eukprot:9181674-Pyramimonas_sp.AAC.1